LVIEKNARKHLHLFVLSQSRFFIATCSGPLYFPSLFGVPTLFTNLIGIGRTTLPFSKNSIHLPKRYVKSNGLHASLTETLHSPFGFGELSMKEYSQLGISIHENSADEILASTVEMFERLEGSTIPDETQLDNRVNEIRTKFEWTSSGSFSTAFLSKNEEWFLK
jgi:putative glycosyltransferase (TIGR04372 family)